MEFVSEKHEQLTGEVVLPGLNRSNDFEAPLANFHAPSRNHYDYRLKKFIQDGELRELQVANMTDLVDEINPDSFIVGISLTAANRLLANYANTIN